MLDLFGNVSSAVRAQTRKAMVHAHNVANLQTENFRPQRATVMSGSAQSVETKIETSPEPQAADAATEMVGLMSSERAIEANMKVLRASDKVLGVLVDIVA
ncbi:hypothetical protein HQ520_16915 [bacterium]|nr:hypothetical protein [bacterium]